MKNCLDLTLETCPALLTVREVSQLLRISDKSAYELIRSGEIPSIALGKRMIRIQKTALLSYLSA